jgi:hypothetical protein
MIFTKTKLKAQIWQAMDERPNNNALKAWDCRASRVAGGESRMSTTWWIGDCQFGDSWHMHFSYFKNKRHMHFCQKHARCAGAEILQQPSGSRKPSSSPLESLAHWRRSPGAGRRRDEWSALPVGEPPPPPVIVAGTPLGLAPCPRSRRKQRRQRLTQKQRWWSPGTIGILRKREEKG